MCFLVNKGWAAKPSLRCVPTIGWARSGENRHFEYDFTCFCCCFSFCALLAPLGFLTCYEAARQDTCLLSTQSWLAVLQAAQDVRGLQFNNYSTV